MRSSALADRERELEDLFDLSLDLLCIATLDGYFTRVNLAFERTLGYTRAELLSRRFYDFVHPEDVEPTREAMAALARGEEIHHFENRYVRSDGAERWLQWNARPWPGEGLVCAAGRDVTDGRRREEQAALRRVATLVAHRTPPSDVFTAVAGEIRQLLKADAGSVSRYEANAAVTRFADGLPGEENSAGAHLPLDGENLATLVHRTGRPARMDYKGASGPIAELMHAQGIRCAVAVPIVVEGRVWGTVGAAWQQKLPVFADSEQRIAHFTELVAAAIANADSRAALQQLADEQAALRGVATLVARGAPPEELFAAVTEAAARLLPVDFAALGRYEPGDTVVSVAAWGRAVASPLAPGSRFALGGENVLTIVARTGGPAQIDCYEPDTGEIAVVVSAMGVRASLGSPVIVDGRLWGVMIAGTTTDQQLPADTEDRLAAFTELLATAIANAESRAELTASRARLVAAADDSRRRIERDLHDGAQQRLVSLALELRATQATLPPGLDQIQGELSHVVEGLAHVQHELQEISRGIHPAILSDSGVGPAVKALARRSPVPVDLDLRVAQRLPEQIEVAAYYVVSEMLTNAAKHADASSVDIAVETAGPVLRISVSDDGRGGADPTNGSGLVGLRDRVNALGGTIVMHSPPGAGTRLTAELPVEVHG